MTFKECRKCKQVKDLESFYKKYKRTQTKYSYRSYCKTCMASDMKSWRKSNKRTLTAAKIKWRQEHPENVRNTRLKSNYGMTANQYDATLERQQRVCALCKKPETYVDRNNRQLPLCVDHNHATGEVRGLLCNSCNRGLGYLRDDPKLCAAAQEYLTNPPGVVR